MVDADGGLEEDGAVSSQQSVHQRIEMGLSYLQWRRAIAEDFTIWGEKEAACQRCEGSGFREIRRPPASPWAGRGSAAMVPCPGCRPEEVMAQILADLQLQVVSGKWK